MDSRLVIPILEDAENHFFLALRRDIFNEIDMKAREVIIYINAKMSYTKYAIAAAAFHEALMTVFPRKVMEFSTIRRPSVDAICEWMREKYGYDGFHEVNQCLLKLHKIKQNKREKS